MKAKCVSQRKRLAMGDTLKGYAKGGSIGVSVRGPAPVGKPASPVPDPMKSIGPPMGAIEKARRNNGVKGMKKGGKLC